MIRSFPYGTIACIALGSVGCFGSGYVATDPGQPVAYVDPQPQPAIIAGQPAPAPATVAYVDVDVAPADIETYPQSTYDGQTVYFYQDHWYSRGDGGRWRYYRDEPAPLHGRRPHGDQGHEHAQGQDQHGQDQQHGQDHPKEDDHHDGHH